MVKNKVSGVWNLFASPCIKLISDAGTLFVFSTLLLIENRTITAVTLFLIIFYCAIRHKYEW